MKSFINKHLKFFNVENPLLIGLLLAIVILSRIFTTYLNESYQVLAPDIGRYSGEFVGQDFILGTINQSYRLINGYPPELSIGYGYGFTIIVAWAIQLLNLFGVCDPENHIFCQYLLYKFEVILSIGGLLILSFMLVKNNFRRLIAIIFLIAFLSGLPGGMGIASGNLDIILSVMYGFMLYFQKSSSDNHKSIVYPILLGLIAGIMLQTKLFVLPILIIFLIFSPQPLYFFISLLITFGLISVIPEFYNITSNPFAFVQAALDFSSNYQVLYTEAVYGNKSTRAIMGNIVFAIPYFNSNPFLQRLLIDIGGILIFLLVLVAPVLTFYKEILKKLKNTFMSRESYTYFIVLNCYVICSIIIWPAISLDYRFFYLIPLIFILIDSVKENSSKQYLGLALTLLAVRSTFIMHARFLNIVLLVFFYFFILTSIRVWLNDLKTNKINQKKRRK